ncbi:MAG: hypothetical protein ACP5HI_08305, partial [Caldimicrobium sp.]
MGQEPRIGVYICHCGINIAYKVDVEVSTFASSQGFKYNLSTILSFPPNYNKIAEYLKIISVSLKIITQYTSKEIIVSSSIIH